MYDATIVDLSEDGGDDDDLSIQEKLISLLQEASAAEMSSIGGLDENQKAGEISENVSEMKPPMDNIVVSLPSSSEIHGDSEIIFPGDAVFGGGYEYNNSFSDMVSRTPDFRSRCSSAIAPNDPQEQECFYEDRAITKRSDAQYHQSEQQLERDSRTTRVRFGTVSIRHYERILTENPSTIEGPSIGIGWNFQEESAMPVYHYENSMYLARKPSYSLVLNREQRQDILLDLGYTPREMASAVRSNNRARNQRRQTVQNLKAHRFEETMETVKGRCLKLFSLRKK